MRLLHLEDNPRDAMLVRALLETEWSRLEITVVDRRETFLTALASGGHDVILSDFRLPNFSGREALDLAREHRPDVPFIFLSGTVGEDVAVEIVHAGAADYLLKDRLQRLPIAIRRALRENEARRGHDLALGRLREQAESLDQARDGIVVTDLEGRVTYWNRGAERIFGWTAAEAFGRSTLELFAPAVADEFYTMQRQVTDTGEWNGEVQLGDKHHRPLVAEVRVSLVRDEAGRPKSRVKIITDITDKKSLAETLLRAQRLESLGLLAAGIAHDLNNVLAPVLMGAPLLRPLATSEVETRVVDTIERSAVRGAALVRQILSFAHGSSSNKIIVQPRHLLRDICELIQQSFPKSIELDTEFPRDLWTVHGNPTQLHQIVLNLCVNARDAMPAGGRLTLRVANRSLDEGSALAIPDAHPGNYVEIEVTDTGTGIAPEILPRIWEPFFTTKGEAHGTGLGLATVRGIAENHGGFVTLDSVCGRGTTFRVFLPALNASGSSAPALQSAHPFTEHGSGELILVVDDEESVRSVMSTILHRQGYRAIVAQNGVEGLALFARRAPEISLVITDVNMPEMGGVALAHALPAIKPSVRILFSSGAGSGPAAGEIPSDLGRVVKKPFTATSLLGAVREALEAPAPPP